MRDDHDIARLLSGRDRLSVVEKEQLFESIVERVQPRAPRPGRWLAPLGLAAAALGALAVVLLPVLRDAQPAERAEFEPRGDAFGLEAQCVPAPCRPGGKLLLRVAAPRDRDYFAVFAQRPDGVIVWYAPAATEVMGRAPASGWLERAVVLDAQHVPGRYRLFGAFAGRAFGRDELKQQLAGGLRSNGAVTVVERGFELVASP